MMGHLFKYELLGNTKAQYNNIHKHTQHTHTSARARNERGQMECLQNQYMAIILLQSETVCLRVILNFKKNITYLQNRCVVGSGLTL